MKFRMLLFISICLWGCNTNKCYISKTGSARVVRIDTTTVFYETSYQIGGTVIFPYTLKSSVNDSLIFTPDKQRKNIAYPKKTQSEKDSFLTLKFWDLEQKDSFIIDFIFINGNVYETNTRAAFRIPIDSLPCSIGDTFELKYYLQGEFALNLKLLQNSDYQIYSHINEFTDTHIDKIIVFKNKYFINGERLGRRNCKNFIFIKDKKPS